MYVPILNRDVPYKCLGHEIQIDNKPNQADDAITVFISLLDKIDRCFLSSSAKLNAVNVMCMSKNKFSIL